MSAFENAPVKEEHHVAAARLHDAVHEVAALVDFHEQSKEIGWAPEDAIPVLAQALANAERQGAKLVMEQRGLIFKKDEIVIDFEHTLAHQRELGEEGGYQELIHEARLKNEDFITVHDLRARIETLREKRNSPTTAFERMMFISPAMKALHDLTPGGSEFVGDVNKCVGWIRAKIHGQHETIVRFKQEKDAAEVREGGLRLLLEQRDGEIAEKIRALREQVKSIFG